MGDFGTYAISAEEVLFGGALLALTMGIHGVGMLATLHVNRRLRKRFEGSESFLIGVGLIVLASWIILVTNMVEVAMWAGFFLVKGAQPSHSVATYNALLNYTTLQAGYLPPRWHLLEGLLGMAGLLTMAWSAGTLYALVDAFQQQQLSLLDRRRQKVV